VSDTKQQATIATAALRAETGHFTRPTKSMEYPIKACGSSVSAIPILQRMRLLVCSARVMSSFRNRPRRLVPRSALRHVWQDCVRILPFRGGPFGVARCAYCALSREGAARAGDP
jgi:hypothetical protein